MRGLLLSTMLLSSLPAAAGEPVPAEAARGVFAQAESLCARDAGRLWGASLCAPIMLVEPKSRAIAASERDRDGILQPRDGVFVGVYPQDRNAANTAVEWSGTRWMQLLWPLPDDPQNRAVLIAHELFHRLQPGLPFAALQGSDNAHLDGFDGRYWLQLEWRALERALQAGDASAQRGAMLDALAFRAQRWRLAADAAGNETALELNEGLAEYTGVMVAGDDEEARVALAVRSLQRRVNDASFVRAFAYATGPAYGLLLDRHAPGWRTTLGPGRASLSALLAAAIGAGQAPAARAGEAVARYDPDGTLREVELERERQRQQRLAHYRGLFVDGPVLRVAMKNMSVQFDPRTLLPLDTLGTVYPKLRVSDDWGVLQAEEGALITPGWGELVLAAPGTPAGARTLTGAGWTLELAPGWTLAPGARPGDLVLAAPRP